MEYVRSKTFFPRLIALLILSSGVLNIVSSLFSISEYRLGVLESIIPAEIPTASRTLTLILGVFLIFLAQGVLKRKYRAWIFSVLVLILSLVLHLVKGIDVEESAVTCVVLIFLVYSRPLFTVKSGRAQVYSALKYTGIALLLLFIYTWMGFLLFKNQFDRPVTALTIIPDYFNAVFGFGSDLLVPQTRQSLWFQHSIGWVGLGVIGTFFASLFAPYLLHSTLSEEEQKKLWRFLIKHGENAVSIFSLMKDKHIFFDEKQRFLISYTVKNGVALVLGDPVCCESCSVATAVNEFSKEMHHRGLKVAFYEVIRSNVRKYRRLGFLALKIGEEAVVSPKHFSLEGSNIAEVRHCVSRLTRLEVRYDWFHMDEIPLSALYEIDELHQQWLDSKKGPNLTFSLDYYPFPLEHKAYVLAIYSKENALWCVLSFFPYLRGKGVALDLMLRSEKAPNSTIEAAIAEAVRFFKAKGIRSVCLGLAPLSDTEVDQEKNILEKGMRLVYNNINTFYGYRSLFEFKKKFLPQWDHKYLIFKNYAELPQVVLAVINAHIKDQNEKTSD